MRLWNLVPSLGPTSNSSSFDVFTTSVVTSFTEVLNPPKSSHKVEISFFQTPVNIDILPLPMNDEMFLLASRMVNPFQEVLYYIHQRNHYLWQLWPHKMVILNKTWNENFSLIHGSQNECCICRQKTTTFILLYISIRALGWQGALWVSSNILREVFFFSRAVGLNSRLIIFSKPLFQQIGCHTGFVVPFVEQRVDLA